MDKASIAKHVRELRRSAKLTQNELAESAGVSIRVIQDVEHGKGNPTLDTLEALANALKTDLHALCGAGEPAPQKAKKGAIKPVIDVKEAAQLLVAFSWLSPERKRAVLALVFDDEAYLADSPETARLIEALLKS